jgi:hypothetical protein
LKPFAENSPKAASKICPRRSASSGKSLLIDRAFYFDRILLIERSVKQCETGSIGLWVEGSWQCARRGGGNEDNLGETFGPADRRAAEGEGYSRRNE